MINHAKKKSKEFIKKYKLYNVDYTNLKKTLSLIGYTIIEFDSSYNDKNINDLIEALNIRQYIKSSRAFTYVDSNNRLVFINKSLNDDEKLLVLSHEAGHIYCNHLCSSNIIGNDVIQENEASEFSHYLLKKSAKKRLCSFFSDKRKLYTCIAILVITVTVPSVIMISNKNKQYYDNYYVTETGSKYHKKNCIFVKHKTNVHRLTKEEFETGSYKPCEICLP